jgi:chromosomal replication initiator protein
MDYLDEIKEIWSMVLDKMRQKFSSTAVNLWFGDAQIVSFANNTLTINVASEFKMQIIKEKYASQIEDIFEEFMGFRIPIQVVANSSPVNVDKIKTQISTPSEDLLPDRSNGNDRDQNDRQPVLGSTMPTVNFEYTFDNFIVGSSNKFAHAACIAVADRPAQDYNPLFIYGPSGLGKTHLLYAVTNEIKLKNPSANIIYIKGEDFTNQMIESLAKKSMSKFRDKYRTCDVLLIDDIQFIAGKESTQEEFFHTFNALYEEGKQIILTSDRPPKDIKTLEDRLKTRFEWGLIADIQPPDLELRIAIFKNKSSQAGISVSDDIITYLAENLRTHIRQIEGAVKKLVAIKFLSGNEITMDTAKNFISELLGGAEPINVTVDKIFAAIEKKYDVDKSELTGKSRVQNVAQARHVAIYLIRTITEMSLPNIGKLFNRDHSTVISSIDSIEKKIASSPAMEIEINELIKEIKE